MPQHAQDQGVSNATFRWMTWYLLAKLHVREVRKAFKHCKVIRYPKIMQLSFEIEHTGLTRSAGRTRADSPVRLVRRRQRKGGWRLCRAHVSWWKGAVVRTDCCPSTRSRCWGTCLQPAMLWAAPRHGFASCGCLSIAATASSLPPCSRHGAGIPHHSTPAPRLWMKYQTSENRMCKNSKI